MDLLSPKTQAGGKVAAQTDYREETQADWHVVVQADQEVNTLASAVQRFSQIIAPKRFRPVGERAGQGGDDAVS